MATHFLSLSKKVSWHLHPKANICAKFHENWWKTEGSQFRLRKIFPPCFAIICRYTVATHFSYHCQKMCLAHLHPKANICAKFHENWWKTEECSSRRKIFSPIFAIICRYHGNTLSVTVEKCCLAHLTLQGRTSLPNVMRIGQKLRK